MYVIQSKRNKEEYLREITSLGFVSWVTINEALAFDSELSIQEYMKAKKTDNYWVTEYCSPHYIHPLNVKEKFT